MKYSFILPAYNEENSIASVIQQCLELFNDSEIIVINDGSTDNTLKEIQKFPVKIINFKINKGKGKALKYGIRKSKGDFLIFIDTDGQDDVKELKLLIKYTNKFDFIIGSRFLGTLHKGSITSLNYFGNRFFTCFINILFNCYITDSQAGVRIIKGDFLRNLKIRSKEYEIETEILIKAVCKNLKIKEIPVNRYKRAGGETQFNRVKNGLRILIFILKEWVKYICSMN